MLANQTRPVAMRSSTPAWGWMLGLFAVLIVVQGALRKWFLPEFSTPLYVAKDVALLSALVLFGWRHAFCLAAPLRRTMLPLLWGGLAFVVALQAFNFNVPSLAASLLGVKSYLLYSALLVLLPVALQRVQRPQRFVTGIALGVIAPVLVLGIYQYFQPVDAWVNQYVADGMPEVEVLERPRITGTFSYLGGMAPFLSFAVFLGVGILLAGLRYKHRWYRLLGSGLLVLSLIAAPMNGSRGVVFGLLVPAPLLLYAVLRRRGSGAVVIPLLVAGFLVAYVVAQSGWASEGWETLSYRTENASDRDTRVQSILLDPVEKIEVGGLVGYGTGATHQAAVALSGAGRVQIEGVYYEGEMGRVLIELGVAGFAFFFALKAWLAWIAWKALRRTRTAWEDILSVTAFCVLFLSLGLGAIVFNHIAGALYWICAGCAVWVWSRQESSISAGRLSQNPIRHT